MTKKTSYTNEALFRVAGTTFDGRQGKLITLKKAAKGAYLTLRREKNNAYDANAVAIVAVLPNGTHMKVGYVPKDMNAPIAAAMDAGNRTRVRAYEVIGGNGYNYGCSVRVAY